MKILFVCLGNICRSPAGENIFRHTAKNSAVAHHWEIDSAGTASWHTGKGPDPRMTKTLQSRGIEVTGKARQITKKDLGKFDLILTMDDENFANVQKLDTAKQYSDKIKKFANFCSEHTETEVPDPYYGGQDGFDLVANMLEDGCRNIIETYSQ
jgi:protein-tyrosine phosphatase